MWRKMANSREEMPEYVERSYHEALVNALAHRDYLVNGSEVHIDIYDDRMEIYSPGGMPDGSVIQDRDPVNGSIYKTGILFWQMCLIVWDIWSEKAVDLEKLLVVMNIRLIMMRAKANFSV